MVLLGGVLVVAVVLHLEVGLVGLLVGEELGALLAALEVGLLLLLFGLVVLFAHNDLIFKYSDTS